MICCYAHRKCTLTMYIATDHGYGYHFAMEIKHCLRCESDWCFRGTGRPLRCGRCQSPYWDRARVKVMVAAVNVPAVPRRRPAPSTSRPVEPALTVNPDRVAVERKAPVSVLPPVAVETAVKAESGGGGWYPTSKCPHGYVNSFACRKAGGGC
jgi:hypothetical protein